jgi:hypothetical protein
MTGTFFDNQQAIAFAVPSAHVTGARPLCCSWRNACASLPSLAINNDDQSVSNTEPTNY